MQHLRELCEDDTLSKNDLNWHQKSLLHLRTLSKAFESKASPVASSDEESESSSYILSPLSLSIYSKSEETSLITRDRRKITERDEKLLDFFSGWSLNQLDRFRKFAALTDRPPKNVVKRSNIVDLFTNDFLGIYNIKKQPVSTPEESLFSLISPVVNKSPDLK